MFKNAPQPTFTLVLESVLSDLGISVHTLESNIGWLTFNIAVWFLSLVVATITLFIVVFLSKAPREHVLQPQVTPDTALDRLIKISNHDVPHLQRVVKKIKADKITPDIKQTLDVTIPKSIER